MRIQLVALALAFCLNAHAAVSEQKEMQALFNKYYQVMEQQKVELIDEVFSKKFIADNGGKEAFTKDVKELPKSSEKSIKEVDVSFKPGVMDKKMFFATVKQPTSKDKAKSAEVHAPEFIVVEEDGKLKIQGTLSDGD